MLLFCLLGLGSNSGGGGGGRIAIHYNRDAEAAEHVSLGTSWTGTIEARGGRAKFHRNGAAGTVYLAETRDQSSEPVTKVIIENGNRLVKVVSLQNLRSSCCH